MIKQLGVLIRKNYVIIVIYKQGEEKTMQKKIKEIVEELLKKDFKCRHNDKWLYIETLRKMGFKVWIDYTKIKDMPFPESVSRVRRSIQNKENMYNDFEGEEGVTYEKKIIN